jgi:predicted dehydrogenase
MKVGVIGTGKMGENHVRTLKSLQDKCQLVGIFDNNQERSLQIAKKYDTTAYSSLDELLHHVDAVSIAVPTKYHYSIGLTCIKHHTHMLMEKPITSTVEQADDLIQKAKLAGVKLQIGHIELFNPLIQTLKEKIKSEEIIGISFFRLNPYDERIIDVDVVKDLMIHDLYILMNVLQDKITKIYAAGNKSNGTIKHAAAIIESSQGIIAEFLSSFKSKKQVRMIQILTENAFIEADLLTHEIHTTQTKEIPTNNVALPLTETIKITPAILPLEIQLADFIDTIKMDKEPTITGEHGKQALEITMEISKAIDR